MSAHELLLLFLIRVFTDPTIWLSFGPLVFNITWMYFERAVRNNGDDSGWPTINDLEASIPLIEYTIGFYSLFIGWVLYQIYITNITYHYFTNGNKTDEYHILLLSWTAIVLIAGAAAFLAGFFASHKIATTYEGRTGCAWFAPINRISVARYFLVLIVISTIAFDVYVLR